MIARVRDLRRRPGHVVALRHYVSPIFGETWRPECIEGDCDYHGPFVAEQRAHEIAEEHRRKSAGEWRPAR